jgi:hypothetical protein
MPERGIYPEVRGYSVVAGEPPVASAPWRTATESRLAQSQAIAIAGRRR